MSKFFKFIPHGLAVFSSIIFLDSLRFKFTDHPNTQEIFGRLDSWAAGLGAPGLFAHTGLFSQYVIGSAELVASSLLLLGIIPALRRLQGLGALIGLAVMSGAISFHLFTPLGIDPNNDGGLLFVMACCVWVSCLCLIIWRRGALIRLVSGVRKAILAN
ncbi:MAG TPA: hypothetical protein ENJ46_01485 [Hellea balneolensis]|uniref:DoxX family protein n=1 Tax=Hellea balneolensis TaxID=287478 RepID=A0A7C3FXK1_9PROT|nr:hypothetical protein [Hellea balneolensis]